MLPIPKMAERHGDLLKNITDTPVRKISWSLCQKIPTILHFNNQETKNRTEVQNGDPPTINYIFYLKIPFRIY
jgi:hypothetical protein